MLFKTFAKNILIIVPHQDDEINLMGGFLPLLAKKNVNIHVTYVTDGAKFYTATERYTEAKKALDILSVNSNNTTFLGYPDDKGPSYDQHLIFDILNEFEKLCPDTIFAIDMDHHPDHRMTSAAFEDALNIFLSNNPNYKLNVFRGFAYSTAFESFKDFYNLNLLATQKPGKKQLAIETTTELDNPKYKWIDRVRMPIDICAAKIPLKNNLLFNAICCYKSQLLRIEAKKIINSDVVFWQTHKNDSPFSFAKILINDNFVYSKYFAQKNEQLNLSTYSYGLSHVIQLQINNETISESTKCLTLGKNEDCIIHVKLIDKLNPSIIYDSVDVLQISKFKIFFKKIQWLLDRCNNYLNYKLFKIFKSKRK